MKNDLDILILDSSSFNELGTLLSIGLLDYIRMSITAIFAFRKNSYVDGKPEKLIWQPQKVALSSIICTYLFMYIR